MANKIILTITIIVSTIIVYLGTIDCLHRRADFDKKVYRETGFDQFDIGRLLTENGFPELTEKFNSRLLKLSSLLNKFFVDLSDAPVNDIPFLLADDLGGGLVRDLAEAMAKYQSILLPKNPELSELVAKAGELFGQISAEIKREFLPLTNGKQRTGQPVYTAELGQLLVTLSADIAGQLTAENAPKFKNVFIGFFSQIGRHFDRSVKQLADRLRTENPQLFETVGQFVGKFNDYIQQIVNNFTNKKQQ